MLRLNIKYLMNLRGIKNPYTFLRMHGFSNHKIRLFQKGANNSIQIRDIETLCVILNCAPNDLFDWTPSGKQDLPGNHPLRKLVKKPAVNLEEFTYDLNPDELAEFYNKVKAVKDEMK